MLIQHLPLLSKQYIVLASASPRRAELIQGLGLKVSIVPSKFDENLDKSAFSSPGDYALETANQKAIEVSKLTENGRLADLVIGADTVVELDDTILEKPQDAKDAFHMLSSLSGRQHTVYTGVSLVLPKSCDLKSGQSPIVRAFWEETKVQFAKLDKDAIDAYIASGEPFGKAGAYGIQVHLLQSEIQQHVLAFDSLLREPGNFTTTGSNCSQQRDLTGVSGMIAFKGIGGSFVKGIHGCYFNVMGFPVHRFSEEVDGLIKAGYFEIEQGKS